MRRIIVIIFTLLLMASCQRNEAPADDTPPIDQAIAYYSEILNQYVLVNEIFQDVVNNTGDAILNAEGVITGALSASNTIPEITVEPMDMNTFPKTITINFGSGTLCRDGVTRRGIITIESTGWYGQFGSVHTTTFNNYYHDIFKVVGTQIIENYGSNEDGNLEFRTAVESGNISTNDGLSIDFEEDATRIWIAGSETPLDIWDDEYLLDAFQYGVSADGTNYLLVFDQPLHFDILPREIKSGIIDLQIGSVSDIEINYNNQTYTILGKTLSWN